MLKQLQLSPLIFPLGKWPIKNAIKLCAYVLSEGLENRYMRPVYWKQPIIQNNPLFLLLTLSNLLRNRCRRKISELKKYLNITKYIRKR